MVVFVGAHTHRATPVPIPNTAVKPVGPMILLQRESRSVPAFNFEPLDRKVEGFFVGQNLTSPLQTSTYHSCPLTFVMSIRWSYGFRQHAQAALIQPSCNDR